MSRANDGVIIGVVAILFFALALQGAATAAAGAFLAALLWSIAAVLLALSSQSHAGLRGVTPALIGAAAFAVLAALTAVRAPQPWLSGALGNLRHPLWAEFLQADGAASLSPYRTIEGIAAFAAPVGAFVLGAVTGRGRARRALIGRSVAFGGGALAILALSLHAGTGLGRLDLDFNSPNAAGALFGASSLFAAAWFMQARRFSGRGRPLSVAELALSGSCLALCLIALVATGSRGAFAAAAAGGAVLAALEVARARTRAQRFDWPVAALGLLALCIAAAFVVQASAFRLDGLVSDFEERSTLTNAHWQAFLSRPLLGHGLNTFHEVNAHVARPETWAALRGVGSAHNIYVQALEEVGIVGVTLLAVPVLWVIARLAQFWRQRRDEARWAGATLAALTVLLLHGFVDFSLQLPAIAATIAFAAGAFSSFGASNGNGESARGAKAGAIARAVSGMAAIAIALGCVIVGEAGRQTQVAAHAAARAASLAPEGRDAADIAARLTSLETSWARPLQWHAGALESQSWLLALEGERTGNVAAFEGARRAAARAVAQSPVQPNIWLRLASLNEMLAATAPCAPVDCLSLSWRAAPMAGPALACQRMRMGVESGMIASADDPRIRALLWSGLSPGDSLVCLEGLPPTLQLIALLRHTPPRARSGPSSGGKS